MMEREFLLIEDSILTKTHAKLFIFVLGWCPFEEVNGIFVDFILFYNFQHIAVKLVLGPYISDDFLVVEELSDFGSAFQLINEMQLVEGGCLRLNDEVKDTSLWFFRVLLVLVAKHMLLNIHSFKIGRHRSDDEWAKLVYFPVEVSHLQMDFNVLSNWLFRCVLGWKSKPILIVMIMDVRCNRHLVT